MARIRTTMTTLTALGLLAGASACGSDDDAAAPAAPSPVPSASTQAPSPSPSAAPSAAAPSTTGSAQPPAGGAPANVSFDDQSGAGDTVQVIRVSMPTAGFVVVTADGDDDEDSDDDGNDRIVGSAPVPAGATGAVTVPLAPPLTQDTDLEAVLYADTDGNGAFDANTDRRIPDTDADTVSEDAGYDVR